MSTVYDLIIIGGGPAGAAAAVYAARKRLPTLLVTGEWGGQSTVSTDIQNWIGTPTISGQQLAKDLKGHVETYARDIVTIISGRTVSTLTTDSTGTHAVTLSNGETHQGKTILIASGSKRRNLNIKGSAEFEHKGLTYCASCDGPMFAGADVAVVGGGNSAFETAAQLLEYAKSVTLLNRSDRFRADAVTVERVLAHPNMTAITNAAPTVVEGDRFVSGLLYTDASGTEQKLAVTGIFVEIGMIPNTDFAAEIIERDEIGRIEIDPWTQRTSVPGIWAAGDCTNVRYHQNNIAAGDGVRALEDIFISLRA